MRSRSPLISIALFLTLWTTNLYPNNQLAQTTEHVCSLTLGWGNWPPYQHSLNGDIPYGIQIDLVRKVASEAGCTLKFKKQTFSENISAVKDGTVDFIMDTSITKEREEFGYFSDPYRLEVLVLYLKPEFNQQCNSMTLPELIKKTGARVGLNQGNIYGKSVTEAQSDEGLKQQFVYADNNDQLYQLFSSGKIDGFFEDPMVLSYTLKRMQLRGKLKACKVTQKASTVSFMFSKKTVTKELVSKFNEALARIKLTKDYRANWAW
ncbi:ABC transporter substrate-binding protein [Aliikangiella sp. G2MR2-5]|uniref:substrate-binding periplasmic protein n=1 Tax=Aliikangiella sp. G2MR2-5 TaxID=2788943 RepID=UPI0018A90DEE|nr:transporter substrate-binding domain-containing protein [Aliikangiella sp. G2MR2-5]